MKNRAAVVLWALTLLGCGGIDTESKSTDVDFDETGVFRGELLSEQPTGCYFYVDSYYRGRALWMRRGAEYSDLHAYGMGDKISSVRLVGGATTTMWIDKTFDGDHRFIESDVDTLHSVEWGDLGDNASSTVCY